MYSSERHEAESRDYLPSMMEVQDLPSHNSQSTSYSSFLSDPGSRTGDSFNGFDHQEAHRINNASTTDMQNPELEFDSVQKRLETFKTWPVDSPIKPHDLAAAGFRYSGLDDEVVCVKCDLHLQQWKTGEDPWNKHRKFRPRCPFVLDCESENGSEVHDSPAGTTNSSKAQDPVQSYPRYEHPNYPAENVGWISGTRIRMPSYHDPSGVPYSEMPQFVTQGGFYRHFPATYLPTNLSTYHLPPTYLPPTTFPPIHLPTFPRIYLPDVQTGYHDQEAYYPRRTQEFLGRGPGQPVKESLSEGTEFRRSVSHNTGMPQGGSRSAEYMQYQGRSNGEEQVKYKKTKHETSAPNQPSSPQKTPKKFYEPYATEKMVSNEDGLVQENCYRPQQRYLGTKSKTREMNPYPLPHKASRWQDPGRNDPPVSNVQGRRRPTPFAAFPVRDPSLQPAQRPLIRHEDARHVMSSADQTHGLNDQQVPIRSGGPPVHGTWGRSQSFPVAKVYNVVRPQTLPLDQRQPHWQTQPVTTSEAGHMTSALQSGSIGGELDSRQRNQDLRERNCVSAVTSPTTPVRDVSSLRRSLRAPMPRSSESGEESLKEKLEQMQEERMCKICMDADANVVFRPCGHLSCCANCGNGLDFCPMCRAPIQEKIRTFFS